MLGIRGIALVPSRAPAPFIEMVHGGKLQVLVDDRPPNLDIRVAGEIDVGTAPRLKQAVDAHARTGQTLTIDLRDVTFIDSMGLAALVRVQHRAFARGARLQLVAPPERVLAVFRLTRLDRIFLWVGPDGAAGPDG